MYISFCLTLMMDQEHSLLLRKSLKPSRQEQHQLRYMWYPYSHNSALHSEGSTLGFKFFWDYLEIHRNFWIEALNTHFFSRSHELCHQSQTEWPAHGWQLLSTICNSGIYPMDLINIMSILTLVGAVNGLQKPVPYHQCWFYYRNFRISNCIAIRVVR